MAEKKYPYIGHRDTAIKRTVLFVSPGVGVCLYSGSKYGTFKTGDWCRYWLEHTFVPMKGSIVLSND